MRQGLGVVAILASLLLHAPARASERELDRCIAAEAEKLDFSGVVSIARPEGTTTYASRGTDAASRFNLASAGKMFTAVAVAQLVDAGKVRLDDAIGQHVKGLTPEASAVTVRQLLTHSSGLGSFFTPENLPAVKKARGVPDLLPLVASERPSFAPGSRFQYSNTGFLLLGALIERASGKSYGDYLDQRVFGTAQMTATGLEPGPESSRAVGMTRRSDGPPGAPKPGAPGPGHPLLRGGDPHARGAPHADAEGPLRPAPEAALRANPAGGAFSTAQDLQKFFAALLGGKLTSAAMLAQLTSRQIAAGPAKDGMPEPGYGFGFGVGTFEGHRWFGHNGGAPGANVETAVYPDAHAVVVVLSNRDPPAASALYRKLRAALHDPAALTSCAAQGLNPTLAPAPPAR